MLPAGDDDYDCARWYDDVEAGGGGSLSACVVEIMHNIISPTWETHTRWLLSSWMEVRLWNQNVSLLSRKTLSGEMSRRFILLERCNTNGNSCYQSSHWRKRKY